MSAATDPQTIEKDITAIMHKLVPEHLLGTEAAQQVSLEAEMARLHVPNLSVAVVNKGAIEWARGYGVLEVGKPAAVNTETLFQAASVSKPVAAAVVLSLVQQGQLDLDADVNTYLKSWQVPPVNGWQPRLTLRQLLSHSGGTSVPGFAGYTPGLPIPTTAQILNGAAPAHSKPVVVETLPGAQYNYSGGGITIAELVCVDVTGRSFNELAQELIFAPLGMHNSHYEQPLSEEHWLNAAVGYDGAGQPLVGRCNIYPELAAAGLWTTPTDLATFGIEIMQALVGKGRVLSQDITQQMLTPQRAAEYGLQIGLGVYVSERAGQRAIYHNGFNKRGHKADWLMYTELGQGAVFMTGGDNGFILSNEVFRPIAAHYGWPGYNPGPRLRVGRPAYENYAAYAGEYTLDAAYQLRIVHADEALWVELPGQPRLGLDFYSELQFKVRGLETEIEFKMVLAAGRETFPELIIRQNGEEMRASRNPL